MTNQNWGFTLFLNELHCIPQHLIGHIAVQSRGSNVFVAHQASEWSLIPTLEHSAESRKYADLNETRSGFPLAREKMLLKSIEEGYAGKCRPATSRTAIGKIEWLCSVSFQLFL